MTLGLEDKVIGAKGPIDAEIVIVGEAPGRDEEEQGVPFAGTSGRILEVMLKEVGIDINNCYVTNVLKKRPIKNSYGDLYVDKKRVTACGDLLNIWQQLREELGNFPNKKIIICLGGEALRAVTGYKDLTKHRGSVYTFGLELCPVVATFHPTTIAKGFKDYPVAIADMRRAAAIARGEFDFSVKRNIIICDKPMKAALVLRELIDGMVSSIAFDIETAMGQVNSIAFCFKKGDEYISYVIPLFFNDVNIFNEEVEVNLWNDIKELLENPCVQKIAHNGTFDVKFLRQVYGIETRNYSFDTMEAFHLLYPEMKKSLAFLTSLLTNRQYYKDDISGSKEEFFRYNGLDAAVTFECYEKIKQLLEDFKMLRYYERSVQPLVIAMDRISDRGVLVSQEDKVRLKKELMDRMVKAQERLNAFYEAKLIEKGLFGSEMMVKLFRNLEILKTRQTLLRQKTKNKETKIFQEKMASLGKRIKDIKVRIKKEEEAHKTLNVGSNKQMIKFLYDVLGLPVVWKKRADGSVSKAADEDAIYKLARRFKIDALNDVVEIRGTAKLISTYVDMKPDKDGRVRTNYKVSGTKTARLSSSGTIWDTGGNLQNVPKEMRALFKASPGHWLMEADLSAAESRVVAYKAGEETMIRLFAEKKDVHTFVAARFFGRREEEIGKKSKERDIAKRVGHGINYLMGPNTMAENIGCSRKEAADFIKRYFDIFPRIKLFQQWIEREVSSKKVLETPLGRKRVFQSKRGHQLFAEATNYIPQATVGEIINNAIVELDGGLLDGYNARVILQIHDAIVVEFPVKEGMELRNAGLVAGVMQKAMVQPIEVLGIDCKYRQMVIPIEVSAGENWGRMKGYEIH